MKSFASVVFLGLFAFVAANPLDLVGLEEELAAAPFEDLPLSFGMNRDLIFKGCKCDENNVCECCVSPKFHTATIEGCVKFSFDAVKKELSITIKAHDKVILDTKLSTKKLEKVCGRLPGKAKILGYCLITESSQTEEEGLTICSTLDITFKETEAAKVTFACLHAKNGKISIKATDSPMKIQVKNPLKIVIDLIKGISKKPSAE